MPAHRPLRALPYARAMLHLRWRNLDRTSVYLEFRPERGAYTRHFGMCSEGGVVRRLA